MSFPVRIVFSAAIFWSYGVSASIQCRDFYLDSRLNVKASSMLMQQVPDRDSFIANITRRLSEALSNPSIATSQAFKDLESRLKMHPSYVSEVNYKQLTSSITNPSVTEKETVERMDVYSRRMVELAEKIKLLSEGSKKAKKKDADFELYREIEDLYKSARADESFFSQRRSFLSELSAESESAFKKVANLQYKSDYYLDLVNRVYDEIGEIARHDNSIMSKISQVVQLIDTQRFGISQRAENLSLLVAQLDMRLSNLKQIELALEHQENASLQNQLINYGFTLSSAQDMIRLYDEYKSMADKRKATSIQARYQSLKKSLSEPLTIGKKMLYSALAAGALLTGGVHYDTINDQQKVDDYNRVNENQVSKMDYKVSSDLRYILKNAQSMEQVKKEILRLSTKEKIDVESILFIARTLRSDGEGGDIATLHDILYNIKPSRPFTSQESVYFRKLMSDRVDLFYSKKSGTYVMYAAERGYHALDMFLELVVDGYIGASDKGMSLREYQDRNEVEHMEFVTKSNELRKKILAETKDYSDPRDHDQRLLDLIKKNRANLTNEDIRTLYGHSIFTNVKTDISNMIVIK